VTHAGAGFIAMDASITSGADDGANSERTIVIRGTDPRDAMQDAKA
jgi:hypothetical protein